MELRDCASKGIATPGYFWLVQAIEKWPKEYAGWRTENGCIYKHRTNALLEPMDPDASGWELVVLKEFIERVLREAHCSPSSGQIGIEKTDRSGQSRVLLEGVLPRRRRLCTWLIYTYFYLLLNAVLQNCIVLHKRFHNINNYFADLYFCV